jgi:phenylpropionate dioxygenase-like ring-hydroxylating dioxygenase large terminal subunit
VNSLQETSIFNNPNQLIEGWYWIFLSRELKAGAAKAHNFLGRELVLFRGENLKVVAMDAYCPHMGAHLAEGKVEENSIRCFFHHWKYDSSGSCVDIPCEKNVSHVRKLKTWPVEEKYGLIWIWTGEKVNHPIPAPPELQGQECDFIHGTPFVKNCHPNVMMINAIDEQHFHSVHPHASQLAGDLSLLPVVINENCIEFRNITTVPTTTFVTRFLKRFYSGPLTYWMSYWFASTGTVTLGPDFQHFHIIFSLRATLDGKAEGQTILVTKKRRGLGKIYNFFVLHLTRIVGNYFAKGDTQVFKTIKFNFETPIKADQAIIQFIKHTEKQKLSQWLSTEKLKPRQKFQGRESREQEFLSGP